MNSGHSQPHGLRKVKGTEVIGAFGLSDAYYVLSLWRATGVRVDDQNHHPQTHPSEGNFLGDQTGRVVRLADSHRASLSPCLNSVI